MSTVTFTTLGGTVKKKKFPGFCACAKTALPAQGQLPAPPTRVDNGGFGPFPLAAAGSARYCDIVVKRGGGNPTQDMTGSIGHAKSYQAGGGGPARQRVCSR